MISLQDHYPLIVDTAGCVALFNRAWLHAILEDAATAADYASWPLVEDVAAGVSTYLQRHHLCPVIRLEEFERMIRRMLQSVGYPELADVIQVVHPVRQISLLHCEDGRPLQDEAEFYLRLQTTIRRCHRQGVQRLKLSDLSACEDMLRSIDRVFPWHEPSGRREKIVAVVRRQISRLSWPYHLQCSIS